MKRSKAMAAIAISAAGVMALGACSSSSDQASSDREAEATQPSASATMPPTETVAMPKNVGKIFDDISVTHSGSASCSIKEKDNGDKNQLLVDCTNVSVNFLGDQVYIKVPDYHYSIQVHAYDPVYPGGWMDTTQRDWAYMKLHASRDKDTLWKSPYHDQNLDRTTPWGVGMNGAYGVDHFLATITYLDF